MTDTPYYDDGHVVYGTTQVPPLPSSDSLHHQQHHLNSVHHQFNPHSHQFAFDGHNEVLTNSHQLHQHDNEEGDYSSRPNRVIREIIV